MKYFLYSFLLIIYLLEMLMPTSELCYYFLNELDSVKQEISNQDYILINQYIRDIFKNCKNYEFKDEIKEILITKINLTSHIEMC